MNKVSCKKFIAMLLVAVVTFSAVFSNTADVEAAGRNVRTGIVCKGTMTSAASNAPKVKTGTNKVTLLKRDSLVRFTAPKTKTYKITVSNPSVNGNKSVNGRFVVKKKVTYTYRYVPSRSLLVAQKLKTQGGKTSEFKVATTDFINTMYSRGYYGAKVNKYLPSRTATIKLKKGETIWIEGDFVYPNATYTLKIK